MRYVETARVPLDSLSPYPGNARTHDDAALDESVEVNGQYRSVVARRLDDHGLQLLAGHGTVDAFARRGDLDVRVEVIEADDSEARRIVLADNATSRNAGYDDKLLLELIDQASKDGGLPGTGWDEAEYRRLLDEQASSAPVEARDLDDVDLEPPADPVTRPGDMWLLGPHRVVCGDCRDAAVVTALLGGQRVNVAFTSPPYASQRKYDEASGFKPIHPDQYVDWFEAVQANVRKVLADDGSWFVNIRANVDEGQRQLYVYDLVLMHVRRWGWAFVDDLAWERNTPPGRWPNRFKNGWEPIFHFGHSPAVKFRPWEVSVTGVALKPSSEVGANISGTNGAYWNISGQGDEGDVLPFNVLRFSGVEHGTGHVAAFPVSLPRWFIKAYSDTGNVVFDPFMGSGTTLVAAHQEGRVACGVEISPGYCDVIARRYQDLTCDPPVLERTGKAWDFTADPPREAAA